MVTETVEARRPVTNVGKVTSQLKAVQSVTSAMQTVWTATAMLSTAQVAGQAIFQKDLLVRRA